MSYPIGRIADSPFRKDAHFYGVALDRICSSLRYVIENFETELGALVPGVWESIDIVDHSHRDYSNGRFTEIGLYQTRYRRGEDIWSDVGNGGKNRFTPVTFNLAPYGKCRWGLGMICKRDGHFNNPYRSIRRWELTDIHNPHYQRIRFEANTGVLGHQVGSLRKNEGVFGRLSDIFSRRSKSVGVYSTIVHLLELTAHDINLLSDDENVPHSCSRENDGKNCYDDSSPRVQTVMAESEHPSYWVNGDVKSFFYGAIGVFCEVYCFFSIAMVLEGRNRIPIAYIFRWVIVSVFLVFIGAWLIYQGGYPLS